MFSTIRTRLAFWRRALSRSDTFLTNDTGAYVILEAYNPFTDAVAYRVKENHGQLSNIRFTNRTRFLEQGVSTNDGK